MAGKNNKKKKVPPPTPPRGAAGASRSAAVSAASGPTPFRGLPRITRQRTNSGTPAGFDSQEYREMVQHMEEEVAMNKARYSTRRKQRKAASETNTAPAGSSSGAASSSQPKDGHPSNSADPKVQPSLHKLQQQRDLTKAELEKKRAELSMAEAEYKSAEEEYLRQAQGGMVTGTPGANTIGAATAAPPTGKTPAAGTPMATPESAPAAPAEQELPGRVPDSIPRLKRTERSRD